MGAYPRLDEPLPREGELKLGLEQSEARLAQCVECGTVVRKVFTGVTVTWGGTQNHTSAFRTLSYMLRPQRSAPSTPCSEAALHGRAVPVPRP